MADAGVLKAGDRLPWLEPYRPPSRRPSNRSAGLAAIVGVAGLAGIATLLTVRIMPISDAPAETSAEVLLPPPSMIKPDAVPPPLVTKAETQASQIVSVSRSAPAAYRGRTVVRRKIKAEPTRAAYSDVVHDQVDAIPAARLGLSAIRHGAPGRACARAQEKSQVAPRDVREGRRRAGVQPEAEMRRVEGDRGVDVVNHVADVHRAHVTLTSRDDGDADQARSSRTAMPWPTPMHIVQTA